MMDLAEFQRWCAAGYNRVPVARTVLAVASPDDGSG